MRFKYSGLLAGLALVVAACGGDNAASSTTTTQDSVTTTQAPTTTTTTGAPPTTEAMAPGITFETQGWPTLANGFHYEGWAIVDGTPISTGKFNVADGEVVDLDGNEMATFASEGIEAATTIVVTIEPVGDEDAIPADTHFVAGDVVDGVAELTIGHSAALGTDFADAAGSFLLATPTDDPEGNELSGIWFLAHPGPVASLELPDLPVGWKYEGWAVIGGTPVTSGTFTDSAAADDAAPFSGSEPGPAFPGEDFVANAPEGVTFPTDLSGATIVISVEPSPDDDPSPFALKPLLGTAAEEATDHESYPLNLNTDPLPTGTATIG